MIAAKSARKPLDSKTVGMICRAFVSLQPNAIDETAIRELLGDFAFKTLAEISQAFGVSSNTPKTWRSNGLTGQSGRYLAADVLLWLLNRDLANRKREHLTGDEIAKRKRLVELELAEVALAKARREEEAEAGDAVSLPKIRSEVATALAILREGLLSISRHVQPAWGDDCALEVDRIVRMELVRTHDRFLRMVDTDPQVSLKELKGQQRDRK